MIRGVWGRALKHLDSDLYEKVFVGVVPGGHNLPRYIMRPAPPDPDTAPALDWILFNVQQSHEKPLWRGWDIASGMGLGSIREPFGIRRRVFLAPDNVPPSWNSWNLAEVDWPLKGDPCITPAILRFEVPLRLIRQRRLVATPGFSDIVLAALRRISALAGLGRSDQYRDLVRAVRAEAAKIDANAWTGERCNLVRWSAAQQREVELFGITGSIPLPHGPGFLWPLLAAAQWSHIGKGTVFGMGEIRILPYSIAN